MARTKKAAPKRGRGAPGKPKSAAHKAAISKALKAHHAKRSGGTKRRASSKSRKLAAIKRFGSSVRGRHVASNLKKHRRNYKQSQRKQGRRKSTRTKASMRARYYRNRAGTKPRRAA